MARTDTLTLQDLMPRHLKNAQNVPSTMTIAVGSSMADAQRQLMLRTFATANGDADRAAKLLGMNADDVRRDLMAMLNGTSDTENGKVVGGRRSSSPGVPGAVAELPASKTKPAKKR
jgi:hypothetical protein